MLITTWEIVNNSPVAPNFEGSRIVMFINDIEENIFNKSFSQDMFDAMIADVNYNHLTIYPDWIKGSTFSLNDYVFYQGYLYKCIVSSALNLTPINSPSAWQKQNKFNTTKYNDLWNKYLCRYLSLNIIVPAMELATVRGEAGGLMKITDSNMGVNAVSSSDIKIWKEAVYTQSNILYSNMKNWIETGSHSWDEMKITKTKDNGKSGVPRRFYFKDRKNCIK